MDRTRGMIYPRIVIFDEETGRAVVDPNKFEIMKAMHKSRRKND